MIAHTLVHTRFNYRVEPARSSVNCSKQDSGSNVSERCGNARRRKNIFSPVDGKFSAMAWPWSEYSKIDLVSRETKRERPENNRLA